MPTKKKVNAHLKPRVKPKAPAAPTRLQNLAARPSYDDMDDQLVDASGVFRVTSSIAQAQTGHDEEPTRRFPNDDACWHYLVRSRWPDGFQCLACGFGWLDLRVGPLRFLWLRVPED